MGGDDISKGTEENARVIQDGMETAVDSMEFDADMEDVSGSLARTGDNISNATAQSAGAVQNAVVDASLGASETCTSYLRNTARAMWYALVENIIYIVLVLICAFVYDYYRKGTVVWRTTVRSRDASEDFNFGLFDCCGNSVSRKLSFFVCCCWPVRWADTMDKVMDLQENPDVRLPRYWVGLLVLLSFIFFGPLTGGLAAVFFCLFATFSRQQFRQGLGMKAGTPAVWAMDCCSYLWCSCCAIVQEGREVENAIARKEMQS